MKIKQATCAKCERPMSEDDKAQDLLCIPCDGDEHEADEWRNLSIDKDRS